MNGLRLQMATLLAALILMAFAVFNGYATFFNDSRSYVRGGMTIADTLLGTKTAPEWKSRVAIAQTAAPAVIAQPRLQAPQPEPPTANRSVYYGLLAFLGYITSDFWLTVFVQAYAAAFVIVRLAVRVYRVTGLAAIAAVVVPLALLTTIGVFVSNIMPDLFAGVTILAAALLLCWWPQLTRGDRAGLLLITAFGLLSHNSHIVILLVLLALALPVLWWHGRPLKAPLAGLGLSIAVALAGVAAFDAAARRVSGERPLLLPHLTAHLVEMGPGMALIHDRCPEIGFAVCEFADRLPVGWVDFLGSRDPDKGVFEVSDLATKRRLSDEQIRFALAVAAHDPLGLAAGLARDIGAQLLVFDLQTMKHNDKVAANFAASFPPHVAEAVAASRIGTSDRPLELVETSNLVLTLAALLYLAFVLVRGRVSRDEAVFIGVVCLGLVANAIVCGGLASPNPRFQARVIWLLPFLGLAHLVWGRLRRG